MNMRPIGPKVIALLATAIFCPATFNGLAWAGLVANWRLDDAGSPAVADGNSLYDGTYTSNVTANQPGRIGTSFAFSGDSVLVDPDGVAAPAPSPTGTVSAWVNPDAGNWIGNIVYNQYPTYIQFRLEDDGTGSGKRLVYRQDGGHDVIVNGTYGAVANNVWTHVVATVSPTQIQLFVGGSLNQTGGGSNGYSPADVTQMRIGGGAGQNFQGRIDDVAIWNSVLSPGKIGTISSILDVNGGALGGYNAFLMNELFQVYDTDSTQAISTAATGLIWSRFTGRTGTAGTVSYEAGRYYAWFDGTSGVTGVVPEIDPAGMGSVFTLVGGVLGLLERRRLKAA